MKEKFDQLNLFICDTFDVSSSLRSDKNSMEYPYFALRNTTKGLSEEQIEENSLVYQEDDFRIEVMPAAQYGHATIFDKDILIYAVSQLVAAKNRHEPLSDKIHLKAHQLIKTTKRTKAREPGKRDYDALKAALHRLKGTVISIYTAEDGEWGKDHTFSLIDEFVINTDKRKRMISIDIKLGSWLCTAIDGMNVLKINNAYFDLSAALQRRLYDIFRKHCGTQEKFKIRMEKLHKKSGSQDNIRKFRSRLKKEIEKNLLPDYELDLEGDIITAKYDPYRKIDCTKWDRKTQQTITRSYCPCPVCGREFQSEHALKVHFSMAHKGLGTLKGVKQKKIPSPEEQKQTSADTVVCHICSKELKNKRGLSVHLSYHRKRGEL